MGFWHTGYAEFHEPTGLGDRPWTPPPPIRYGCQLCTQSFADLEELRKHRFEQHPVRQPTLLLRGKPVGALPQRLTTPLEATDVLVEDASGCLLNGEPVDLGSLGRHLAAFKYEYVKLELRNQGATTRCVLDFHIADESDLVAVETAFLRLARERVLSIEAVSRFNEDCRVFTSAMPYCDGIAHYLYGVMAKECAPDSGLKRDEYVQRYLRSSDELSGFDRSLARSVRSLVAFHFNQFDDAEQLAPLGPLRHAAGAFAGILRGMPWQYDEAGSPASDGAVEDMLTDQETLHILADATHDLVKLERQADDLLAKLCRSSFSGYDRMKRILLTCEALAARNDEASHVAARRLAREVAAKPETVLWARGMLERLFTQ